MRVFLLLVCTFLLFSDCTKSGEDPLDGFVACDMTGADYFEPTDKTFIPPRSSDFIDTLPIPLVLSDGYSFVDLTAEKVCELEQQLAKAGDFLSMDLCVEEISTAELNSYKYQYVGLRMDGDDYIFVNAFELAPASSFDWKNEAYIGYCFREARQWGVLYNIDQGSFSQYQSSMRRKIFFEDEFPYDNLCGRCVSFDSLSPFQLTAEELCLLTSRLDDLQGLISEGCINDGEGIDFNQDFEYKYMGVISNEQKWIYLHAVSLIVYEGTEKDFLMSFYRGFIPARNCKDLALGFGVLFNLETKEFFDLQFEN